MLLGAFIVTGAQADILLDNISGGLSTASAASQDFEASIPGADIVAIEKFSTTASAYEITAVAAAIDRFNTSNPTDYSGITGWRIEIYSSVAAAVSNLTGDVKSLSFTPAQVTLWNLSGGDKLAEFTLSEVLAPSTDYFIGVIPVMNFAGNGQIGILVGTGSDSESWQANPGGTFNLVGNQRRLSADLAYRVEAAGVVPEPASMVALGLGLAVVVRRRRKV